MQRQIWNKIWRIPVDIRFLAFLKTVSPNFHGHFFGRHKIDQSWSKFKSTKNGFFNVSFTDKEVF